MVSNDEIVNDWVDRGKLDEKDTWDPVEVVDNIIKLVGENKLYWAGIALCDLRERLKNGE